MSPASTSRSRLATAVLLLTLPATGQVVHAAGNSARVLANAYTRGGAGLGSGELLQRFDADELQGYGLEVAQPGFQVVRGILVQARDFGFSTPNGLFDVTLYGEDPLRPNLPNLLQPLGGAVGVAASGLPLSYTAVPFAAPALVPPGQDLFVGIRVNATTSQFGGLRLNLLYGTPQSAPYDLAGPALPTTPPERNGYRLFRDLTTNTLSTLSRGQYLIDLLTTSPGGFPTAITNQANYTVSAAPGASTLLSGLHPDAASPPLNPGRADDVGFYYRDPAMPDGTMVIFAGAFATFGPLVPLDTYVPGSLGGVCLDPAAAFVLGFATTVTFDASWVTAIPAAVRPALAGVAYTQQAFGYDAATGTLRGTQCGKQVF